MDDRTKLAKFDRFSARDKSVGELIASTASEPVLVNLNGNPRIEHNGVNVQMAVDKPPPTTVTPSKPNITPSARPTVERTVRGLGRMFERPENGLNPSSVSTVANDCDGPGTKYPS